MDRNIGGFDRAARMIVAAPLAFIGWEAGRKHHGKTSAVAFAAATEVMASSVTGFSPLYAALGFSTKGEAERPRVQP